MEKIAIMTDVNAGTDYLKEKYDIKVLRSMINFGDDHYIDGVDIKADEFYRKLQKTDIIPSTSAPTLGEATEYVSKMVEDGYTDVIMYAISYKLSSIGNMVESLSEDFGDKINIHVVDTKTSVYNQAYLAIEAYKMAQEGKSVKEILDYSNYIINNQHAYFVVDDLMYLVKNGRLSGFSGFLGSLLKIKPILEINDEGAIVVKQKERTAVRALNGVHDLVVNDLQGCKKVILTVYHTAREEDAKKLAAEYKKEFPCAAEVNVAAITPAVGAHIGCGVLGISYIILER